MRARNRDGVFALSPILEPLAPVKGSVSVLSNVAN